VRAESCVAIMDHACNRFGVLMLNMFWKTHVGCCAGIVELLSCNFLSGLLAVSFTTKVPAVPQYFKQCLKPHLQLIVLSASKAAFAGYRIISCNA